MAKERLSKLQKWILLESYKLNVLRDESVVGNKYPWYLRCNRKNNEGNTNDNSLYQYYENWIYENYYGYRYRHGSGISYTPEYKRARVTVSRSVKNLEQKGLLDVNEYINRYMERNWRITVKGIAALNLK